MKNQVDQLTGAAAKSISVGDNVFLDETVRTGQESTGKFVLTDATNLAMGPKSTVKLDRFVFSGGGESTYSKAVINLTKGTFRFITGNSAKTAYEIDTPTASIGVRGPSSTSRSTREAPRWRCRKAMRPSARAKRAKARIAPR